MGGKEWESFAWWKKLEGERRGGRRRRRVGLIYPRLWSIRSAFPKKVACLGKDALVRER